jgi:arginine-tRNA-protein transferase
MARTCCPQYTIRCDARTFKPDKKHRAVINRFNRFLETGSKDVEEGGSEGKAKGKGKAGPYDWMAELHKWEKNVGVVGKRKFEVSF